jgi:hypothetical protein
MTADLSTRESWTKMYTKSKCWHRE